MVVCLDIGVICFFSLFTIFWNVWSRPGIRRLDAANFQLLQFVTYKKNYSKSSRVETCRTLLVTCTIENHYTYTFEWNQYKYVPMFFNFFIFCLYYSPTVWSTFWQNWSTNMIHGLESVREAGNWSTQTLEVHVSLSTDITRHPV